MEAERENQQQRERDRRRVKVLRRMRDYRAADLQLAGYSILCDATRGLGVQLKDNGEFTVKEVGLFEMAKAKKRFIEILRNR